METEQSVPVCNRWGTRAVFIRWHVIATKEEMRSRNPKGVVGELGTGVG